VNEPGPIRVLIVDDEPLARTRVRQLLNAAAGQFFIVGEAVDGQSAVASALQHQPDVIFLDIQMPDINGFEVLDALESAEAYAPPRAVVFVTGYDRYAIRAFEANAADYLLKPIAEARSHATVERLQNRLRPEAPTPGSLAPHLPTLSALTAQLPPERRYLTRVVVPDRGRVLLVPVADVECVTAADNYVKVSTASRVYLLRSRVSELAARLDPADFARVHRSHIVAIRHIREMSARPNGEYDIRLVSGHQVRASRAHRDTIRSLLSRLAISPTE
jgi:two-component system LytT family response regulator